MTLVYLIAFGAECLGQFKICYKGLKLCHVDVLLITDQDYKNGKVNVIKIDTIPTARDQYIFRTSITDYIDIYKYDRVWYMDCDILIFSDVFQVDSDAILLSNEPKWTMGHECFSGALSDYERRLYYNLPAINAGIYSVPKKFYSFFQVYRNEVKMFTEINKEINIPEQMVLNSMYAKMQGAYPTELLDVGYPEKGVNGDEMIYHFACYQFKDKLKLMKQAWQSRTR